MDYETINGPKYYFDFENLRQGIEQDIEGDEWFDRRLEEMESENCYSSQDKNERARLLKNEINMSIALNGNEVEPKTEPKDSQSIGQELKSEQEEERVDKRIVFSEGESQENTEAIPLDETIKDTKPGDSLTDTRKKIIKLYFGLDKGEKKPNSLKIKGAEPKAQLHSNKGTRPPGRSAAMRATKSITAMYKPKHPPKTPSSSVAAGSSSAALGCTLPTTPKVMKRCKSRQPNQMKSTEELEMEKIQQLKHELEQKKQLSKQSFKRMKKHATPSKVARSVKPTTEAVGFNFKTDARLKSSSKEGPTSSAVIEGSCFPMNLRSYHKNDYHPNDPSEHKPATPLNPTHVKPFRFLTEERIQQRKRHRSGDQGQQHHQEKYVSTAEYMEKFQKTTPPRFRTKVPYDIASTSNTKNYSTAVTLAKTPNLQSRHRSRPVTAVSMEEREAMEAEEMKKHQFKARPLNPDILRSGGEFGIRQPSNHPLTKPVSPCLATKERFGSKRDREEMEKEEDKEKKEFKAHPIPHAIFDKITGVPQKRPQTVTAPYSPLLSFKKRKVHEDDTDTAAVVESSDKQAPPPTVVKPLPMPDFSNVFKPTCTHSHTMPEPFSFENKYPLKEELVKELVKKDNEEAAKKREFHANPLPDLDFPDPLPPKKEIPHTEVKPFKLDIEERVKDRLEKFKEKISLEEEEARRKHEVHATENKALNTKPFVPVKTIQPLTESSNIVLHTALRVEERSKYDTERKQRELEKQMEEEKRKILREQEEEEQLRVLRKSLVHKALPIHDYPPVNIQPSSKPLTNPKSPVFTTVSRLRTAGDKI